LVVVALLLGADLDSRLGQNTPAADEQKKTLTPEGSLNCATWRICSSRLMVRDWLLWLRSRVRDWRLRHIWIYDAASGVARQITFSGKSNWAAVVARAFGFACFSREAQGRRESVGVSF